MLRLPVVASLFFVVCTGAPLCAQDEQGRAAGPAAASARVQKAIADFEAARGGARDRLLLWLGELDSPEVDAVLRRELAAAGDKPFAAVVLMAVGRARRSGFAIELWQALQRPSATPAIRLAAAGAIVRQGDREVDRLLGLVRGGDDAAKEPVRNAALAALASSGEERALRGIAPLLGEGSTAERLRLLRQLEAVQGVPSITAARMRLVGETNLELAATAWRQLAAEGNARAKTLILDVLERIGGQPKPAEAAEVVIGLAFLQDPDYYPVLLRFGAGTSEPVRRALRKAAPVAAKDRALVTWLATEGLESAVPAQRDAALVLLREAPPAAVQPLLAKVRARLRKPDPDALNVAIGLHDFLAKDPSWKDDVLVLAFAREPEVRTVGLSLLAELGCADALEPARQALDAREWPLRSAAYRYLGRFRDVASIPLLIARVGREEGRLAVELENVLFVHTGTRHWRRGEWEAWWEAHRTGFVLPREETVRNAGAGSGTAATISYYDIPLVSSRVAFLLDTSGSMSAPLGTDRKVTRLEGAKQQLARVLEALPETHSCNLVVYQSTVDAVFDGLRRADEEHKKDIRERIAKLAPAGGTNIFDALERAFADPEVDTIYLLTDGEPSVGRFVAADDILDEVRRWNRRRQVVVHGIAMGLDSELLKRLASESGGRYVQVK